MDKKLLAAAVGMTLTVGTVLTAQADVKVYGMLQFELANEKVDAALPIGSGTDNTIVRQSDWNRGTTKDATDNSAWTQEDNQRGRFGIMADEDLGGGLKGVARLEYDTTNSGSETAAGAAPSLRRSWVGLQGGFGTFLIGTLDSPYKYVGGVKYDPFVTTNLEARRNGGMTGGNFGQNGFLANTISYKTSKNLPVEVWVVTSLDEQGNNSSGGPQTSSLTGPGANTADKGDYVISAKIGGGGWEAFLVTLKNKDNSASGLDYKANKVGGKLDLGGGHTFVAQYEDTDNTVTATTKSEGKVLFLGYHLKMGNNTFVAQLGDGELKGTALANKQDWKYYTLGVNHFFSKTARFYGGYTVTDVDNLAGIATQDGKRKALAAGLRKDF